MDKLRPRPQKGPSGAFPASENAKARQSKHVKAVVAVRFGGDLIAALDKRAKEMPQRYTWKSNTRTDVIMAAVRLYLSTPVKG